MCTPLCRICRSTSHGPTPNSTSGMGSPATKSLSSSRRSPSMTTRSSSMNKHANRAPTPESDRRARTIEEVLTLKPEARPRIYAYSIADEAHKGLLKVGQTTRDVKQRVSEQLKTAAITNYTIELDEPAERND